MRKIGILIIGILISLTSAYADGLQYFDHVRSLYEQGRYEEALQGFNACKKLYSNELDVVSIDSWIGKCNAKIKARETAEKARRDAKIAEDKRRAEAERAEAERKAYEAKQQERIEKQLLYVSSNAFIFDKEYTGMHQAIKGYIADNSNYRFTNDLDMAYWSVYVSANAADCLVHEIGDGGKYFTANVVAYVTVKNEITGEIIYEGEVSLADNKHKSTISAEKSATKAYKIINEEIGSKILEQLNY